MGEKEARQRGTGGQGLETRTLLGPAGTGTQVKAGRGWGVVWGDGGGHGWDLPVLRYQKIMVIYP